MQNMILSHMLFFKLLLCHSPGTGKKETIKGWHLLSFLSGADRQTFLSPTPKYLHVHDQTRRGIALALFMHCKGHRSVFQLQQQACMMACSLLSCSDNKTNGSQTFLTAIKSGPGSGRRHLPLFLSLFGSFLLQFLCLLPLLF